MHRQPFFNDSNAVNLMKNMINDINNVKMMQRMTLTLIDMPPTL